MEMHKPTDAHRKLGKLIGTGWVKNISPFPSDPKGNCYRAIHNRLALNGFVVVQDYEQERNGSINFGPWYLQLIRPNIVMPFTGLSME
jgi:hypothetical protein